MTDRELLTLAAKAAGIVDAQWQDMSEWGETRYGYSEAMWSDSLYDSNGSGYWNPITDDGDALRLAVRLNIDVCFGANYVIARGSVQNPTVNNASDSYAATRYAIVRAAAEIGRTM